MVSDDAAEAGRASRAKWRRSWAVIALAVGAMTAMSFFDGFTKNWADLEVAPRDPSLAAVVWPLAPGRAVEKAASILGALTRWEVIEADPERGTLHATHKTRVWRFVDDVNLRFEAVPGGTRITGRSRSRIGQGDLGQNARNLRELVAAFR